ncbi:MAG TPA: FAD-linked oxidase C-terminal domain-containing protein, partial [Polyangiaceae bacterium]
GIAGRTPDLVALVNDFDQVSRVLEVAEATHSFVTPRAAGTGKSGGALALQGGVVLSLQGFNRIKDIDRQEGIAVVEPGVVLADLQKAVEAEGLFYPPDPNSQDECTLGGNVAENAGGPRAFKYGVTRDYVLGMQVALMGGQRLSLGRRTRKGVTGYDLTALLVGSEGTLGVIGDITLKLIPKPPVVMALMAFFLDVRRASACVTTIGEAGVMPRCIEMLDRLTLDAMRAAGHDFPAAAQALLIIEVDGDEAHCERQADMTEAACSKAGAIAVTIARDEERRERIWRTRREMSHAIKKLTKHKMSEDVVVPRSRMPELLERVERCAERERIQWLAYGHAGDGNLHVNYLWNEPDERPRVDRAIAQLFRDTVELQGTLSGEHGIGVTKAPYLSLEQSDAVIALQQRIKAQFDPKGLLNPGKIFPSAGHRNC